MTVLDVSPEDVAFLDSLADEKPVNPPPPTVSGFAQDRRNLPAGSPFPGPWDNAKTPYFVEIMDCFSAFSPVKTVAVMKGRKVGATTALPENIIPYWIEIGAPIGYVTATDALAKDWATTKLPPAISSFGLDAKITAQNYDGNNSARTGSTTYRKEYFGGVLDIFSAGSTTARRALDKRLLFIDEVDGVPAETSTGEGNWVEVLLGHGMAWGDRFKALLFSSPTTEQSSNIFRYYLKGDQSKYYVPCPHCGHMQPLDFDPTNPGKTMRPVFDGSGRLEDCFYICQSPDCGRDIASYQKADMIICRELGGRAEWRPTAIPAEPNCRSFYLPTLYSPPDMVSFKDFYSAFLKATADPEDAETGLRSFVNIYMGWVFKEQATRPELREVMSLRGDYLMGTVPQGVLYLTMGIDVQPDRLEYEVLGHGLGYRTWSITYQIIDGPTDDPYGGAWEKLHERAMAGGLTFERLDGRRFDVQLIFADSGNAAEGRDDVVFRFCTRWRNTHPIKGFGFVHVDKKRAEKGDIAGASDYKKYRHTTTGVGGQSIYQISTWFYKTLIFNQLRIPRDPSLEQQRPGSCEFPADYDERYFAQLTAAEKRNDGSFHKVGQHDEALDCRVYALCAADVWLDAQVQMVRVNMREQGATAVQVAQINGKHVLERMASVK